MTGSVHDRVVNSSTEPQITDGESVVEIFSAKSDVSKSPQRKQYSDFVKNESEATATEEKVTNESESGNEPAKDAPKTSEVPDKFKGKSTEEIVASYKELERAYGQRGNELGELRQLTDTVIKQQLGMGDEDKESVKANKSVTPDELLENPQESIDSAVSKNPEIKKINDRLAKQEEREALERIEKGKQDLDKKFDGWVGVVKSEDFVNWVKESPVRVQLYKDSDQNLNFDSANELLGYYKLSNPKAFKTDEQSNQERTTALNAASTEKGGAHVGKSSSKKIYRRADIIKLQQTDPAKYNAMSNEIKLAYQEGRVR